MNIVSTGIGSLHIYYDKREDAERAAFIHGANVFASVKDGVSMWSVRVK